MTKPNTKTPAHVQLAKESSHENLHDKGASLQ